MLRMIEDRDGVEDRKPLTWQIERVDGRPREALVPPGRLVGEKADRAAEERRRQTRPAGNADGRHVLLERREWVDAVAGVADHSRGTVSEHRPSSHGSTSLDRLEQEAIRIGPERAHRGN